MSYTKLSLLGLTLFVLTFTGGCALFDGRAQGRGAVLEEWQTKNEAFKIRVTSYAEVGANVNGAYYRFETAPLSSNDWREIMTFRHDDRPAIPKEQIRFLNDRTAHVFMGWMYAVTTDGGVSWSVWDATKDLPNWQCCNYRLIREVQLVADGTGKMPLNPIPQRMGEVSELYTQDYGRHWVVE
jgi:hypothetical protein